MAYSAVRTYEWLSESYLSQKKKFWPREGRHILAQFDENTIVVYQAYKPNIARYAVANQKFGGPEFSFERMSWIKTNFLWMMYRCGWASKRDQERVLAVRITRKGFEELLSYALTAGLQKSKKVPQTGVLVRLQWDPDHSPAGGKMTRRAIQLGLKGDILRKYGTEWVTQIDDITDFVKKQYRIFQSKGEEELMTASERVYSITNPNLSARLQLDVYGDQYRHAIVVKGEQHSVRFTGEHSDSGESSNEKQNDSDDEPFCDITYPTEQESSKDNSGRKHEGNTNDKSFRVEKQSVSNDDDDDDDDDELLCDIKWMTMQESSEDTTDGNEEHKEYNVLNTCSFDHVDATVRIGTQEYNVAPNFS